MGRAAPDIPDGMRVLHGRFARWRKSHTGRLPIPDPLWAAAAEMAREHGVFRTAKVLSLEYGKLKRLTTASHTGPRRTARLSTPPAAFVELLTPGRFGEWIAGAGQLLICRRRSRSWSIRVILCRRKLQSASRYCHTRCRVHLCGVHFLRCFPEYLQRTNVDQPGSIAARWWQRAHRSHQGGRCRSVRSHALDAGGCLRWYLGKPR